MEFFWIGNNIIKNLSRNLTICTFFKKYINERGMLTQLENQDWSNASFVFETEFHEIINEKSNSKIHLNLLTANPITLNNINNYKTKYIDLIDNMNKIRNIINIHKQGYVNIKALDYIKEVDYNIAENALQELFILFNNILDDNKEIPFSFNYPDDFILEDLNERYPDRTLRTGIQIY